MDNDGSANSKFPHQIVRLDEKTNEKLIIDFSRGIPYFVQVGPEKWLMPNKYERYAEWYYNLQLRPDDVFVMGYPRSGNTLMDTLVWLLLNDLDFKRAEEELLSERVPFLEHNMVVSDQALAVMAESDEPVLKKMYGNLSNHQHFIENRPGRRIIKTHLPLRLLPQNLTNFCKIVYIVRHPKDVIVSYYHLQRLVGGRSYVGTFENYYSNFENNLSFFAPYFDHVKLGWNLSINNPNVLFMTYEQLTTDLRGAIEKTSKFFNVSLGPHQVTKLEDYLKFDNFKNSKVANTTETFKKAGFWNKDEKSRFVRKGAVGGWRDYFTDGLDRRADGWIAGELERTGLKEMFKMFTE